MALQQASHYRGITDAALSTIEDTLKAEVEAKILDAANAGMASVVVYVEKGKGAAALANHLRDLGFSVDIGREYIEIAW